MFCALKGHSFTLKGHFESVLCPVFLKSQIEYINDTNREIRAGKVKFEVVGL